MINLYVKLFDSYCTLLNATLKSKGVTKKLFLARGGLRLRKLFEKKFPLEKNSNFDFYTSRLAVIKAATYIAPDITALDIAKEYNNLTMSEMLGCFLGGDDYNEYIKTITDEEYLALSEKVSIERINAIFGFQGSSFLRSIVENQYHLIQKYWKDTVAIEDEVALVDTGWSGTIVFYLKLLFPVYSIDAYFFGKSTYGLKAFEYHKNVHGIMFDTSKPIANQGYSYLIENRHLIEMICELNHPSTEGYCEKEGKVEPLCGFALQDCILGTEDEIFHKIYERYEVDALPLNDGYLRALRQSILWPTKSDVSFLSNVSRSADFGKDIKVNMLHDMSWYPSQKIRNIRNALWFQGQVVQEFGSFGRILLYLNYQVFPFIPWLRNFAK